MLSLREVFAQPQKYEGEIQVCGWVRTVRQGKAFGFIELNDGTNFKPVQIVFNNDERNLGKNLSTGCAICVMGRLILTPDAPQPFEIHADDIILEGACPSDYPMQKSVTALSFYAPCKLCVPAPIPFWQPSVCARWYRLPFTSSFRIAALFMCTPQY